MSEDQARQLQDMFTQRNEALQQLEETKRKWHESEQKIGLENLKRLGRAAEIEQELRVELDAWRNDSIVVERDKLKADLAVAVEALEMAAGYMHLACQPDKGDLFGEFDDKNLKALAKIRGDK